MSRIGVLALACGACATAMAHGAMVPATLVAAVGSTLPGSGAAVVSDLGQPVLNGLGQVGFSGRLGGTDGFQFVNNTIALRNSQVVTNTVTGLPEPMCGIGDAGQFIYSPNVDGEDGVWTNNGLLARGTQPAPGMPGMFFRAISRPTMSPDGTSYFVATTNTTGTGAATGRVLYKVSPGPSPTLTPLTKTGDAFDGLVVNGVSPGFNFEFSDNNAHNMQSIPLATSATAGATRTDIARDGIPVARTGDPTGQGDNFQAFKSVNINNAGNYLITGDTDGPSSSDDFIDYNGAITLREGTNVGGRTLGLCNAVAINNFDQVVSVWTFNASNANKVVLFGNGANPAARGTLIATGDTVDTNNDLIADYTLTDITMGTTTSKGMDLGDNNDLPVYLNVTLTPIAGGSPIASIIGVNVPEPTAMLGAAVAVAGIMRRTRVKRR